MNTAYATQYEIVNYEPLKRLSCKEYRLPYFTSPYHQHSEIEITGILSSEGILHVGGEVTSFKPGECYLLGSQLPHKFHNNERESKNDYWAHSAVLHFEEDCLGEHFFNTPELHTAKNLINRASRGIRISGADSERIIKLLKKALNAQGTSRVIMFLTILHEFSLSQNIEYLTPIGSQAFAEQSTDRLDIVTRYIYKNLNSKITLNDLAHVCDMNTSSFSRFFKSTTGRTLTSFINEIRCREACRFLRFTDRSIMEIAFDSGYENLSTFNRCFKQFTGETPKSFRRRSNDETH